MQDYFLFPGTFGTFKTGQRAPGLHLNRMVRDVLRECGYPCFNCNDKNCNEPNICDLITNCSTGTGSSDFSGLTNVPQSILDLAGITGTQGDILYFDGTNWVTLPVGTDGQVLTLAAGLPSWAAGSGGASSYLSLTDTPSTFGADDIVPTVNTAGDALVHETDNRLHTETLGYATVIGATNIDSFNFIDGVTTVIGNKAFSDFSGSIVPEVGGTFPGTITYTLSLSNLGKKYPGASPTFLPTFYVNGQAVEATIVGGGANSVTFSIPVQAESDTITYSGHVIVNV